MSTLTLRERTLIGLAVAGLLIVVVYLYVAEPLVVRSRELAEVAPDHVGVAAVPLAVRGPELTRLRHLPPDSGGLACDALKLLAVPALTKFGTAPHRAQLEFGYPRRACPELT